MYTRQRIPTLFGGKVACLCADRDIYSVDCCEGYLINQRLTLSPPQETLPRGDFNNDFNGDFNNIE